MQETVGFRADIRIQDDDTLVAADSGPTVALSSPGSFPATGRFTVNIVFSEDVTGFELADISVANGTAGLRRFRRELHGENHADRRIPRARDRHRSGGRGGGRGRYQTQCCGKQELLGKHDGVADGDDRELGRLPRARGIRRHDPVLGEREPSRWTTSRSRTARRGTSQARCHVLGGDHSGGRLRRRRHRHRSGERGIGRRRTTATSEGAKTSRWTPDWCRLTFPSERRPTRPWRTGPRRRSRCC